jgi:hypothetical protein
MVPLNVFPVQVKAPLSSTPSLVEYEKHEPLVNS